MAIDITNKEINQLIEESKDFKVLLNTYFNYTQKYNPILLEYVDKYFLKQSLRLIGILSEVLEQERDYLNERMADES